MRLGGGDFPVTNGSDTTTLRSAYLVLDITDPERPPRILAEISDDELNLTTSEPDIFYDCGTLCDDNNSQNNFDGDWKLVFGSGPNNIRSFSTTETAKIFTYNLNSRLLESVAVVDPSGDPIEDSFVGNVAVRDWDNGTLGFRNDDAAYFGTVGTTFDLSTADPTDRVETGAVFRYVPSFSVATNQVRRLIDVNRPVVQAPILANGDAFANNVLSSWVYFGTGIYLNAENEEISERERIYGVIEPVDISAINNLNIATFTADREDSDFIDYSSVSVSQLIDVSDVTVLNNDNGVLGPTIATGDLGTPLSAFGETATNADELSQLIFENSQGWFRDLPLGVAAGDPSTRIVDRIVPVREQIFLTAFTPDTDDRLDICIGGEGISQLFVLDQNNGVPSSFATLGVDATTGEVGGSVVIGEGAASAPIIFTSEALGSNDGTIIIQRQDGSLTPTLDNGDDFSQRPIGESEILRSSWFEIFQ